MKKGVIFTIDAIVALSIFIVATIGFYSFFIDTNPIGISGYNIYSESNNLFYALEESEIFSAIFHFYQKGMNDKAINLTRESISYINRPCNLYFYVFNNSKKEKILEVKDYDLDEFFVLRRYTVLTLTRGIEENGTNIKINISSIIPGNSELINLTLRNPEENDWNVSIKLEVYNLSEKMNWSIVPPIVQAQVQANSVKEFSFNLSVPKDAVVDEYYIMATVSGDYLETAVKPFNVILFGIVKIEVGR